MQNTTWKSQLRLARSKIKTAPADALLTAACVCYHGPLDNCTRAELMHDWLVRCEEVNFDPNVYMGQQVKSLTLSARIDESIPSMKPVVNISESMHSGLVADSEFSHKADDVSSILDGERASSTASQMSLYRHRPSIYDIGVAFKTEVKVSESADVAQEMDTPSTVVNKSLLAVREGFTLQDVLSTFEERCEWKGTEVPGDVYSLHNSLIMRVCCHVNPHSWPLLVDPDGQAEMWIKLLQNSQNVITPHELQQTESKNLRNRVVCFISIVVLVYFSVLITKESLKRFLYLNYSNKTLR